MAARTKREDAVIEYPVQVVLFQYRDRPKEWHVCAVQNGAFGWGGTPEEAIRELELTLQGQIRETFATGNDFFFFEADPAWRKAYEEGAPPADDVRIVARMDGSITLRLHGRPAAAALRMRIVPPAARPA